MTQNSFMSSWTDSVSAEALTVALNCVATPTFLLRPDGHIVHINTAGTELLRASAALRRVHSRLVARRSDEAKALAAVLVRVAESQRPELLRLLSRNGNVVLLMTVTPVPGNTLVVAGVADLNAEASHLADWLQEAFALSPQNAELAESLLSGVSLIAFSGQKNVTLGAARTRLKKLFTQTGTNSQAALVSVLLRAAIIAARRPG